MYTTTWIQENSLMWNTTVRNCQWSCHIIKCWWTNRFYPTWFCKSFWQSISCLSFTQLPFYRINGDILNWIADFLTNRHQEVILNNAHSDPCDVLSGVPQGSILGPLLFLLFINDLPNRVTSNIRLYADDITIYRTIYSNEDILQLQKDLDNLSKWASDWFMTFNVSKCEHLVITKMHSPISSEYKISGCNINKVTSAKYLGVTINHDLSWGNNIGIISCKTSAVFGFLQRNLRQCSSSIKSLAYLTYVRPILEYASTVWAPYTKNHIMSLEKVQRRAARFVCNNYSMYDSLSSMLDILNWPSLEDRRRQAKCIMFYKIINNIASVNIHQYLQPSSSRTRGHDSKFIQLQTRVNVFRHSFLSSTIRLWNSLPLIRSNLIS